nr:MAG TPA: hypothetical protein [Caudoviricetes sp.]
MFRNRICKSIEPVKHSHPFQELSNYRTVCLSNLLGCSYNHLKIIISHEFIKSKQ